MSRWVGNLGWLVAAAAFGLCVSWVASWGSPVPDPWEWRQEVGLPGQVFTWDDVHVYDDQPNFVVLRWGRLASIYGPGGDLGRGVWWGVVLALVWWGGLVRWLGSLTGNGATRAWMAAGLALLVFSPLRGATWLLFDRWRVWVPVIAVTWGVVLMSRGTGRGRVIFAAILATLAALADQTGLWAWLPLAVCAAARARRLERAPGAALAGWVLFGNLLAVLSRYGAGGQGWGGLLDVAALRVATRALGGAWLPSDPLWMSWSICGVAMLVLGLAVLLVLARQGWSRGVFPVAAALSSFAVMCALQAGLTFEESEGLVPWTWELAPGCVLLPLVLLALGLSGGASGGDMSQVGRRQTVAVLVLVAAAVISWVVGYDHLRTRAQDLGRAEAQVILGHEIEGLTHKDMTPRVWFHPRILTAIQNRGRGHRLGPIDVTGGDLGRDVESGAGMVVGIADDALTGRFSRGLGLSDDLLLFVSAGADDPLLVDVVVPDVAGDDWSVPGERLRLPQGDYRVLGFSARTRSPSELAGTVSVDAGGTITGVVQ